MKLEFKVGKMVKEVFKNEVRESWNIQDVSVGVEFEATETSTVFSIVKEMLNDELEKSHTVSMSHDSVGCCEGRTEQNILKMYVRYNSSSKHHDLRFTLGYNQYVIETTELDALKDLLSQTDPALFKNEACKFRDYSVLFMVIQGIMLPIQENDVVKSIITRILEDNRTIEFVEDTIG